jgi:hypothetical protein
VPQISHLYPPPEAPSPFYSQAGHLAQLGLPHHRYHHRPQTLSFQGNHIPHLPHPAWHHGTGQLTPHHLLRGPPSAPSWYGSSMPYTQYPPNAHSQYQQPYMQFAPPAPCPPNNLLVSSRAITYHEQSWNDRGLIQSRVGTETIVGPDLSRYQSGRLPSEHETAGT